MPNIIIADIQIHKPHQLFANSYINAINTKPFNENKSKKKIMNQLIKFCVSEQFKLLLGIKKTKKRELDTVASGQLP